jgi:hypothetical protein
MFLTRKAAVMPAFMVIIVTVIIMISFWVIIPAFATVYSTFTDDTQFNAQYTSEEACFNIGYWDGAVCNQLPDKGKQTLATERRVWLLTPWILIISMWIWYFTASTNRDVNQYGGFR